MPSSPLPCIKCGTQFEDGHGGMSPDNVMPSVGTQFSSHGHYGSTAWDPMSDPSELIINICDPCLVFAADAGLVLKGTPQITDTVWTYRPWKLGD
jgi:hypothetical protein